jgi:hypothetical protein
MCHIVDRLLVATCHVFLFMKLQFYSTGKISQVVDDKVERLGDMKGKI